MKALIVASSKEEMMPFIKKGYSTALTGTGLSLAAIETTRAIIEEDPDIVINIGTAGTLSDKHKIGDILSFCKVYNRDQDLTAFHLPLGATLEKDYSMLREIRLIGEDNILLSSSAYAISLLREIKADAADMECYSVALSALKLKKKAASFKLITDIAGEKTRIADYRRFLREGREALEEAVSAFLKSLE